MFSRNVRCLSYFRYAFDEVPEPVDKSHFNKRNSTSVFNEASAAIQNLKKSVADHQKQSSFAAPPAVPAVKSPKQKGVFICTIFGVFFV